jgi:hypothetical protein
MDDQAYTTEDILRQMGMAGPQKPAQAFSPAMDCGSPALTNFPLLRSPRLI